MEGGLVILAIVGVAALIIWAVAASIKAAAKRREELFLLAQNWGFQYLPDGLSEQWEGSFWENLVGSGPGSPTVRFLQNLNGFRNDRLGQNYGLITPYFFEHLASKDIRYLNICKNASR